MKMFFKYCNREHLGQIRSMISISGEKTIYLFFAVFPSNQGKGPQSFPTEQNTELY